MTTFLAPVECPACHRENPPEAQFCLYCGTKIDYEADPTPVVPKSLWMPPAPAVQQPKPQSPLNGRTLGCGCLGTIFLFGLLGRLLDSPNTSSTPTANPVGQKNVAAVPSPTANPKAIASAKATAQAVAAAQDKTIRDMEKKEKRDRQRKTARAASLLDDLQSKRDDVEEVTWYQSPASPKFVNSRSAMWLYFGKTSGTLTNLHLKMTFVNDEWLFIEKYIIKADGRTFEIEPEFGDVKRDNGGEEIWEWYDLPAEDNVLQAVKAVANADNAVIRYDGQQYRRDRTVGAEEKQAMRKVLAAYEAQKDAP